MLTTPEALRTVSAVGTPTTTVALERLAEEAYTANLIEVVKLVQDATATEPILDEILDRLGIGIPTPASEQEWQR